MEKLLFSADLHGNIAQYDAVLRHAKDNNFDIVIFGGDLTPKKTEKRTPKQQREFLENELFPLLDEYKDTSEAHVLFIMGNDDFRSNHSVMVDGQDFHRYRMIDQIPYISKDGHVITGYTYVPYTPFPYKCWERRDLETDTDFSFRKDIRQDGVISHDDNLIPYSLVTDMMKFSIEEDLNRLTAKYDPKKTILVSHAPPYDTVCDYNREHKHVGSRAIRKIIEEKQFLLTLHGHIHECADLTGQFKENIGETVCAAVANDHKPKEPFVIEIEIGNDNLMTINRRQLGL